MLANSSIQRFSISASALCGSSEAFLASAPNPVAFANATEPENSWEGTQSMTVTAQHLFSTQANVIKAVHVQGQGMGAIERKVLKYLKNQ